MITFKKRIWSLANMVIDFITGIGTIVFVTREYSTKETGSWFLFIAVFAMAGSLRDALIQPALVKDTAGKSGSDLHSILKSNLSVAFFFELILSLLVVAIGFFLHSELGDLLLWYPLYSLPSAWQRWQIFFLRSRLELEHIMYGAIISFFTLLGGMICIALLNLPITSLVFVLSFSCLSGALYMSFIVKLSKVIKARGDRSHFKNVQIFGLFGMGREATSAVSSRISLFITSSFLSLQLTAILGISQRFAQVALLPNNSFQSVLFPGMVQAVEEGDISKARNLFHDSLSLLLAITIPASLIGITASPYLLTLISGPQYESSWIYLSIYVLIATLITPFGAAFGSAVTAWGKPHLAFRLVLVNSILNIILSLILIKTWGLIGAPLAMIIVEIFGLFWVHYLLKKISGINIIDTFKLIPKVYYRWIKQSSGALISTPRFNT